MPINVGLIDRAIRQPLETITVTAGTVQESLLGTPEDLPLTEPGTSQIIFTVQEANLPILSYGSCTNAGVISCSGRNLSGSYATIYYRILKNGSSAYTGSKTYISYSGYYNLSFDLSGVVKDDIVELRIWSSVSNVNWDFKGFCINPTKISIPFTDYTLLTDITITTSYIPFTNGGTVYYQGYEFYIDYGTSNNMVNFTSSTSYSCYIMRYSNTNYSFGRVYMGGKMTNSYFYYSGASRQYWSNIYISQIKFRNTKLVIKS